MPIDPDITRFAVPGFFYDKIVYRATGSVLANGGSFVNPLNRLTIVTLTNTYGKKIPVFVQISLDGNNWYLYDGPSAGSAGIDFSASTSCSDSQVKILIYNGSNSNRIFYYRVFGVHLWPN